MAIVEPSDSAYWRAIRRRAQELGSDGCTAVPDFYRDVCLEHDVHYRTHARLDGSPIRRAEADRLLRLGIQARSPFGRASPMSWWRWAAVRAFGRRAWA